MPATSAKSFLNLLERSGIVEDERLSSALDESLERARVEAEAASTALRTLPDSDYKNGLLSFAEFAINRAS